jgi:hypothetical protein
MSGSILRLAELWNAECMIRCDVFDCNDVKPEEFKRSEGSGGVLSGLFRKSEVSRAGRIVPEEPDYQYLKQDLQQIVHRLDQLADVRGDRKVTSHLSAEDVCKRLRQRLDEVSVELERTHTRKRKMPEGRYEVLKREVRELKNVSEAVLDRLS